MYISGGVFGGSGGDGGGGGGGFVDPTTGQLVVSSGVADTVRQARTGGRFGTVC